MFIVHNTVTFIKSDLQQSTDRHNFLFPVKTGWQVGLLFLGAVGGFFRGSVHSPKWSDVRRRQARHFNVGKY